VEQLRDLQSKATTLNTELQEQKEFEAALHKEMAWPHKELATLHTFCRFGLICKMSHIQSPGPQFGMVITRIGCACSTP